ncbi:aromatic amino acid transport family protein [Pantoea sp. Mhis]|uniref:aromatic amino acid transport family protein n=1 Tax=Pantoea sp. Mhis TaxID=2576759 RepID=UPI00351AF233
MKNLYISDILWMLSLYGTAIGAGVLFLPINAGMGGIIPLIIMAILAFPMTFYAHQALTRFVLSSKNSVGNITEVIEEHFGILAGKIFTFLYFFAIYPILLMYGVAITNTVDSFIVHQLGLVSPPRILLSLVLVILMTILVRLGEKIIITIMSILVLPFVIILLLIASYIMPYWHNISFKMLSLHPNNIEDNNSILMTLWLIIPVTIFSFNHSPIISSFAVAKRKEYGFYADKKCSHILIMAHLMMVITVMFFVFSCVFSLSTVDLKLAKVQNITILSYLANHFNIPIITWFGPIIAIIAITKSFLGHYLGAHEGFNSLLIKFLSSQGKIIPSNKLNRITTLFILITTWIVSTINPSILGMIETLGGPIIAIILFLLPMYAIQKVPEMYKYQGKLSNLFIIIIGLLAILQFFIHL